MDRSRRRHWRRRRVAGPLPPGAFTLDPPRPLRWPWLAGGLLAGTAVTLRVVLAGMGAPVSHWQQLVAVAVQTLLVLEVTITVALVARWRGRAHARVRAAASGLLLGSLIGVGLPALWLTLGLLMHRPITAHP